jgi:Lamin Tail Domain
MKKTLSILAGLFATHASFGAIYITEIMYNPLGPSMPDSTHEFVEIYNSAISGVNVQNWTIAAGGSGDLSITSSSLVLAPGAFLVIGNTDIGTFNSSYNVNLSASQYVQAAGTLPSLSDTASSITIKNAGAVTQASVSYQNAAGGWPTGVEGNSITFGFLPAYAAPGDYQIGSNWDSHNTTIYDPNGLLATPNDAGGLSSPGYMLPVPEPTSAVLMGFGILLLRRIRSKK